MASVDTEANISVVGTDTKEIPLGVRLAGEFTLSGKTVRLELIDSGLTWRGQGQTTGQTIFLFSGNCNFVIKLQVSQQPGQCDT